MTDLMKKESIHLAFSLVFLGILLITIFFIMPKVTERMGRAQADGFWTAERKANARRLFGGEDDAV
jgi:uncharacterized protein (UPF0333 family)